MAAPANIDVVAADFIFFIADYFTVLIRNHSEFDRFGDVDNDLGNISSLGAGNKLLPTMANRVLTRQV